MAGAFVKAIDAAEGIFHGTGNPFQLVGFHLTQVDNRIFFQNAFAEDKVVSGVALGKRHLLPFRKVGGLDLKRLRFLANSASFGGLFHADQVVARRIPVIQILKSRLF